MGIKSISQKAAEDLLRRHRIRKPMYNLEKLAEKEYLYVEYQDLKGQDGRIIKGDGCGFIAINENIKERGRRRFTLAHEIGHYLIDRATQFDCTHNDLCYHSKKIIEKRANRFAAELLMPEGIFREEIKFSEDAYTTINTATALYNVTLTAAAFRYAEIGDKPIAVICSKEGMITWMKESEGFRYGYTKRDRKVSAKTDAGLIYRGTKTGYYTPSTTKASEWFEYAKGRNDCELNEQSISMPNYKSVLTLLWRKN